MSSTARKLQLKQHYNTLSKKFGFSPSMCRYLSKELYTKTEGDLPEAINILIESLNRPRLGSELRKKYPKEYLRPFSKTNTNKLIQFLGYLKPEGWELFKKPENNKQPI